MPKHIVTIVALILLVTTSNFAGPSRADEQQPRRIHFEEFKRLGGQMDLKKRVEPEFPLEAARKCQQGYVIVLFDIDAHGRPFNTRIAESDPQGVFEDAASSAILKWRYSPPSLNDVPVIVTDDYVGLTFQVGGCN